MREDPSDSVQWLSQGAMMDILEDGFPEDLPAIQEEFGKFCALFFGESPRAAVILGAAQLDSLLQAALERVLLPAVGATGDHDELLGIERPLGTFGSRIHASYRMGLIADDFRSCLIWVKCIRNQFAHRVFGVSLEDSPQKEWVRNLVERLDAWPGFAEKRRSRSGTDSKNETDFKSAVAMLCARLQVLVTRCSRFRAEPLVALIPKGERITGES